MSNLYPRLADCRTRALKDILGWVTFDGPPKSETEKVWRAVALMIDDELRFRDPRRKPAVPRTAHPQTGDSK